MLLRPARRNTMADAKTAVSSTFNKVAKHLFSPVMIFMMVAMALPTVGMAAVAAGKTATLGDIAMGTADMFWNMISAPFTDGGVAVDAVSNAAHGNFAANSYQFGSMDHAAHTVAATNTAAMTTAHHVAAAKAAAVTSSAKTASFFGIDPAAHSQLMMIHK
jgi:hypothetical protein